MHKLWSWRKALLVLALTVGTLAALPAAQAQQSFAHGAVVALQGTPHLWIADAQGTLHWGGDTRALAGKHVNWGDRTEVGLDRLRTLPVGDPWLSAGLLKDGDPIYLVKWESDWAQPQLLHIQSIADVELFGINGSNYGNFVIEKSEWEQRFGISAAGLQRGVLPSAVSPTFNHNVMVRVVVVTPDWHGYHTVGGWPTAVSVKESDVLKFFEVAIWEETKSIHFYEFNNDFDSYGYAPQQVTSIRETYAIMRFDGLPEPWTKARSQFIRQAFADFTAHLADRYPDSGTMGPEAPVVNSSRRNFRIDDADGLLSELDPSPRPALGVIDMGGTSKKGSFSDLENFCQYARYYIARICLRAATRMDDWTIEKYHETDPESQYHALLAAPKPTGGARRSHRPRKTTAYEYSRENMIESRNRQANYLYSCQEFADFRSAFRRFLSSQDGQYDVHDGMVSHGADGDLKRLFDKVFVHHADNRRFLPVGAGCQRHAYASLTKSSCIMLTTGISSSGSRVPTACLCRGPPQPRCLPKRQPPRHVPQPRPPAMLAAWAQW